MAADDPVSDHNLPPSPALDHPGDGFGAAKAKRAKRSHQRAESSASRQPAGNLHLAASVVKRPGDTINTLSGCSAIPVLCCSLAATIDRPSPGSHLQSRNWRGLVSTCLSADGRPWALSCGTCASWSLTVPYQGIRPTTMACSRAVTHLSRPESAKSGAPMGFDCRHPERRTVG